MRDSGQALSLYKKIVEVDPAHYNSVVQIANLYAYQKNPDAVDYYNMALRLNEFGLDALYGRAYFYQQMGYIEEAVKDYQQIVEINPTHTQSIYNIAYLNFKKKSWNLAKSQFAKLAELSPTYVPAWYMIGLCFEAEKNTRKAADYYQKCLQLDASFSKAQLGLTRLTK